MSKPLELPLLLASSGITSNQTNDPSYFITKRWHELHEPDFYRLAWVHNPAYDNEAFGVVLRDHYPNPRKLWDGSDVVEGKGGGIGWVLVLMLLFAMHRFKIHSSKEVKRWSMLVLLWFDLVHGVSARVAADTGSGENVLYSQVSDEVEEGADSPRGARAKKDNGAGAMAVQRQLSGDGGESSLRPILTPSAQGNVWSLKQPSSPSHPPQFYQMHGPTSWQSARPMGSISKSARLARRVVDSVAMVVVAARHANSSS